MMCIFFQFPYHSFLTVISNLCVLIPQYHKSDKQLLLVGHKCDLTDKRVVSYDKGKQVSLNHVSSLISHLCI